jgi:hypothetical protein
VIFQLLLDTGVTGQVQIRRSVQFSRTEASRSRVDTVITDHEFMIFWPADKRVINYLVCTRHRQLELSLQGSFTESTGRAGPSHHGNTPAPAPPTKRPSLFSDDRLMDMLVRSSTTARICADSSGCAGKDTSRSRRCCHQRHFA